MARVPREGISGQIRAGSTQDGPSVAALFGAARAAMTYLPALHTAEEDRAFFTAQLAQHDSLLATDARGELLGFALFGNGWLHHLYLSPAHQGRGIGSALLGRVKARMPESVTLWTFQANAGARRFYERHGFRCVEQTDGSANEERVPDARYLWAGAG